MDKEIVKTLVGDLQRKLDELKLEVEKEDPPA